MNKFYEKIYSFMLNNTSSIFLALSLFNDIDSFNLEILNHPKINNEKIK